MRPIIERNKEQKEALGAAITHIVCCGLIALICIIVGSIAYGFNGFLGATLLSGFVFVLWGSVAQDYYETSKRPVPGQRIEPPDHWPT
ncbi:MAG: hypothetical protein IK077_15380 [Thermoguttaceae bacterium]|nr:hypothetical protein [Thermoguttaceae bacterium]